MVRAVLDTNVLISAMLFGGKPRRLLDLVIEGKLDMVTALPLLDEFEQVLRGKFRATLDDARRARETIASLGEVISIRQIPAVSRDPDDDVVIATALAGHVDLVVTGDSDLLDLKEGFPFAIITIAELVRTIDTSD